MINIFVVNIILINQLIFVDYSDCFFHHSFSLSFFIHSSTVNHIEYICSMKRKTRINIKLIKLGLVFFKMISMKQSIHVVIVLKWNEKINHWMIGNFSMFLVLFQKSKLSLKNTIFKSILFNVINNIKQLKNVIKKFFFGKKVMITFFKKPSFFDFESWPCQPLW